MIIALKIFMLNKGFIKHVWAGCFIIGEFASVFGFEYVLWKAPIFRGGYETNESSWKLQ